jgi:hypothetical protein
MTQINTVFFDLQYRHCVAAAAMSPGVGATAQVKAKLHAGEHEKKHR